MEPPKDYCAIIYIVRCTVDDKGYVGQTTNYKQNNGKFRPWSCEHRWSMHISHARGNKMSLLQVAIREHGEDKFTITEIERCPIGDGNDREQHFYKHYNTRAPNGYNSKKYIPKSITRTGMVRRNTDVKRAKHEAKLNPIKDDIQFAVLETKEGVAPLTAIYFTTKARPTRRVAIKMTFTGTYARRDETIEEAKQFALKYTDDVRDSFPSKKGRKIRVLKETYTSGRIIPQKCMIVVELTDNNDGTIHQCYVHITKNMTRDQAIAKARGILTERCPSACADTNE